MGAARVPGAHANGTILALWRSFASAAGGIHTTHAERRAARQSSSARTANATTPQVYPLLRRSSARPRSRPRARRGGFEERRLEVKDSGRRKMNLILMWSRRWRRWRPTSPWRRRCDHANVYAPREGAAAVSRRRRLRRAGRRLQARARRTVASTSTRKAPASRSSTHGYVLTTSARCGTRASSFGNVTRRSRTDFLLPQPVDVRARNPAFSGAIAVA